MYTGARDHELRPPLSETHPLSLSERLVLHGSCAFLALMMVNISVFSYGWMLGLHTLNAINLNL